MAATSSIHETLGDSRRAGKPGVDCDARISTCVAEMPGRKDIHSRRAKQPWLNYGEKRACASRRPLARVAGTAGELLPAVATRGAATPAAAGRTQAQAAKVPFPFAE